MSHEEKAPRRRNWLKMASITAGVAVVGMTFLGFLAQANIDHLLKWQISQKIGDGEAAQEIPDSLFEVFFCGTGTPSFSADRGQPCLGIVAGGKLFMFDAGQNAAGHLKVAGAPFDLLDTVFLTHLHSDHISGLGNALHAGWLYGRKNDVEIIGPPGTARLLDGFQEVYAADIKIRRHVVEADYVDTYAKLALAKEVQIDSDEAVIVYDKDGVVVRAFRVIHPDWAYAYGYRIDFGGKSVVISGDTSFTPALVRYGKDVDLLIHEAFSVEFMSIVGEVMEELAPGTIHPDRLKKIASRHTPTREVARTAAEANVKKLILTHLTPPIPASSLVEGIFTQGMDEIFDGEIVVARDGMRVTLLE